VFLEPGLPEADPRAVQAILRAQQVVLGPGSLFTSLLATLIVPGIREALSATSAKRIFVCNTRTQKGETDGLDAGAHLDALASHVGDIVDAVIVQDPVLEEEGVTYDPEEWPDGIDLVEANVAGEDGAHDPLRLAGALRDLGRGRAWPL
jgi:uncharacterized cofD-like protein